MIHCIFSENIFLTQIISICIAFVELLLTRYFFVKFFKVNFSKKKTIIFLCACFPLEILNIFLAPLPRFPFINIGIVFIFLFLLFINYFNHIPFLIIIPLTMFQILKSLFIFIIAFIFKANPMWLCRVPFIRLCILIPAYISMFLLMCLFKRLKLSNKFYDILDFSSKFIINLFSFTCLASVLLTSHFLFWNFSNIIFIFIILNILLISIITILSIKVIKLQNVETTLDCEKKSYTSLSDSYDGIRSFKHDFFNIMQSIGGYLLTDDLEGLKKYYSNVFKECEEIKQLSIFNKDVLNSPPVLSLISEKYKKAKDLGIDFSIEVFVDLNKLNMNIYEFTRILGIFLDNSIEAACNCSKKFINIVISKDARHHFDFVTIENSYQSSTLSDTNRIFEKNFSTKPKNSGLGLWKVKNILKKYDHISLNTSAQNNLFRHQLKIYY